MVDEYPRGGTADGRFARVAEAFTANFAAGDEIGAAVCVYQILMKKKEAKTA